MAKGIQQGNEEKSSTSTFSRRGILWIIAAVVGVAIILIAMPQKKNNLPSAPIASMMKKQGECMLSNPDGKLKVTVDIEIADDDTKREIGLMGRPVMDEKEGMLFIFEQEFRASFWMKNTILPLDMLFVNARGEIVTIHKNTTPYSEQSYTATALTLFVLEVNAGFCDTYGVKEGDKMTWKKL